MPIHLYYGAEKKSSPLTITGNHSSGDPEVLTRSKTKLKRPSMYEVVLLNDDYTPMDFVVYILERFFSKSSEEAVLVMLDIHNKGSATCGVYSYEVAEAKCIEVRNYANQKGHPLECIIRKE